MSPLERWLRNGLGRAAIFLQTADGRDYRDEILHACTHDLTYDRQCEESRAHYLLNLIDLTGEPCFYHDAIVEHLRCDDESLDFDQMFELGGKFAADGSERMKAAMYEAFERQGFANVGLAGADQLIILDGVEGFRFAMRSFDQVSAKDRAWMLSHVMETFRTYCSLDMFPEELRTLYAEWEEHERVCAERRKQPFAQPSYEEVRGAVMKKKRRAGMIFWAKRASEADVQRLARDLLEETDIDRLYGFVRLFHHRAFPGPIDRLLELVNHGDEDLARVSMCALANLTSPQIRPIALEAAENPETADLAVKLLIRNRAPGDEKLVERLIEQASDDDSIHSIGMEVKEYVEAHPYDLPERSFLRLYECGPCSICRWRFVEFLFADKRAPAWLMEECRYDCYSATRELIQGM